MHNEALKMLRKEKGFTQAEMAEMLEVSRQSYIAWERGTYQVPVDIEKRLADAGMATRVSQKMDTTTIKRTTHPQCWLAQKGWYWTLAHPHWFASSDCPIKHLVPKDMYDNIAGRLPTLAEYAAHKPPSPESVFELMLGHGADRNAILKFMVARGYHQFGELVAATPEQLKNQRYNAALAQWNAEHPDEPGWGPFEAANPEYRDVQAAPREQTQEQINSFERFKTLADSTFAKLNQTTNNQE
jgi:DNA-binding XRE family transcriptional regulator